ncbi:MAG TPA: DUF397 domain-containing protein [Rugosimonospora sp.]|nr:DUF397 domain-containing protein [Rugosimonospora sp.]
MGTAVFHTCWRKSSYSGGNGGNCVEVATLPSVVAVRDSKRPDGGMLVFSRSEWAEFVDATKVGEFDR